MMLQHVEDRIVPSTRRQLQLTTRVFRSNAESHVLRFSLAIECQYVVVIFIGVGVDGGRGSGETGGVFIVSAPVVEAAAYEK